MRIISTGLSSRLQAADALRSKVDHGIGFNWFDFLGMGGFYGRDQSYSLEDKTYPDWDDAASWAALRQGLDELRPGFIRFGLPPDPHVNADGSFNGDTIHMRRLAWLNEWAAANDCTIMVDTFTMPVHYEFELPQGQAITHATNMAAADNRRYAREFVLPLLRHIAAESGMEAVKLFNPINEPMEYGVYQTPEGAPDMIVHYVDMYREIREALDEAGIGRDRIGLVGLDNTTFQWYKKALQMLKHGVDINPYVEAYSIHYYTPRFDHLQEGTPMNFTMDTLTADIAEYCHERGRALYACEMGTFHYGWREEDPASAASFDACLTIAEAVIRGINQGVGAFAFWSLMNPNTVDGWWRVMGAENGELQRSPYSYHVQGLLSRFVRPRSTVYPLRHDKDHSVLFHPTAKNVHGTALEAPDGRKVVLLVNDNATHVNKVGLQLPAHWGGSVFQTLTTDRVRQREQLEPAEVGGDGELHVSLNPFSLTVLHQEGGGV